MESVEYIPRHNVEIKNGKLNRNNKTKMFTTWNNVKLKEEVSSDEDIIICEESSKVVNSTLDTQEVSTNFAYFKCDKCKFKTINLALLVNHMNKHDSQICELKNKYDEFQKSEVCHRKLAYIRLGKSMHICPGGRSFKCLVCESKFLEVSDLRAHVLDHDEKGKNCKCNLCEEKKSLNLNTQQVSSNTADSLKIIRKESENTDLSNIDVNLNKERVSLYQEDELNASDDWQTIQLGKNSENIEDDLGICNIAVKIIEDSDSEYEATELANYQEDTSHDKIKIDYRNVYILSDNGEVEILGAPEKYITEVDLVDVTDKENLLRDEILSDDSEGEIMSDYSDVEILGAPEKNVTVVDLIDITDKEENKQNVLERKKTLRKHENVLSNVGKHKKVLSNAIFNCKFCNSSYKFKRSLKSHYLRKHSNKTGEYAKQCAKCLDLFKTIKEYNEHYKKYHDLKCLECKKIFKNRTSLKSHCLKKHQREYVKQCVKCNKEMISKKEYNEHYKKHHSFECLECEKSFKTSQGLKIHCLRKHSNVKQCTECYEQFKTMKDYNEHYTKYHPFQCLECEKKFTSLTLLKQHYNEKCQKNIDAVIACSFCGKTFVNGIVYQNHMQQHLKLTTKCEDTISTKNIHENPLKMYNCKFCDETLDSKEMSVHMSYHRPNLNYKCTMCIFSCFFIKDIRDHIKSKHKNLLPHKGQIEGQIEKILRAYKFEFDKIKFRVSSNSCIM